MLEQRSKEKPNKKKKKRKKKKKLIEISSRAEKMRSTKKNCHAVLCIFPALVLEKMRSANAGCTCLLCLLVFFALLSFGHTATHYL